MMVERISQSSDRGSISSHTLLVENLKTSKIIPVQVLIPANSFYRWEFEKGRKALTVSPQGPASFDDSDLVIQAVLNGVGIGTAMEETLRSRILEGRLIQVLRDWCPTFQGYFLYYPSRRNQPAALAALIDTLRLRD